MSALAARRAAQLAQGVPSSPATSGPSGTRAKARPKAPSISSAESDSADSEDTDEEPEAGPSKPSRNVLKPRYYAAAPSVQTPPGTDPVAPQRKAKRKRAYSPGAPVGSDSDDGSSATDSEEEGLGYIGEDGQGLPAPHANGQSSASRNKSGVDGGQTATSNFSPRRGVNVEIISASGLRNAGLEDVAGSGIIISLSASENLSLAGVFHLIPLQGSIDIFSTNLVPSADIQSRHAVFAPISHPIPNISHGSSSSSTSSPLLSRLQLPSSFDRSLERAIFLVLEYHTGIEGMRGGAIPGFNTVWGDEKGWMGLKGIHAVPGSILSTCYPYTTSESWSTALNSLLTIPQNTARNGTASSASADDIEDSPIVLVKGPKRSGKSTIARVALNTLLGDFERVAWLECDLGQGEFGCGGVIGLWILDRPVFGPPFTHPRQAHRAHFLGTYTPLTCPDEYLAAIDNLLQYYRYEIQYPSTSKSTSSSRRTDTVPLIINTQGWVRGLGEELLRALEGLAQASHVFAFNTAVEELSDRPGWTSSPTLPPIPLPLSSTGRQPKLFLLEPAHSTSLQARYTAIDHRILSTLSYFHSSIPSPSSSLEIKWDFSTPLVATTPYEIILGETIKSIYMIGEGSDGVVPADLSLALNGSMVALYHIEDLDSETDIYAQNRSLPSLDEINFLGYAIIRAISPASSHDLRKTKLHTLTPLSTDSLSRVNAIVKNGAMEIPTPGMLDWRDRGEDGNAGIMGVPWGEVPFFDTGSGGVGVERRRWRRNLMRKGM